MRLMRLLGSLLALPSMPFLWAWLAVRRAVQTSAKPAAEPIPPNASLVAQALDMLQQERADRGLEPLDLPRAVLYFGASFDQVHIDFQPYSIADGEEEGLRRMAELGTFRLTPKMQQEIQSARDRARLACLRAGARN